MRLLKTKVFAFFISFWVLALPLVQGQQVLVPGIPDGTFIQSVNISKSGKELYVVGKNSTGNHIYRSTRNEGAWSLVKKVPIYGLTASNTINGVFVNASGNKLYFAADISGTTGGTDIFYIEKDGDSWTHPKAFAKPVNSFINEGSPSVSTDENMIIFTRPKAESPFKNIECKQMLISYLLPNGTWSEPEVLPSPLNLDCEESPVLVHDNRTLFFSSVRKRIDADGKVLEAKDVGFDLYFAKMLTKGVWATPSLLPEFSTEFHDMSLTIPVAGSPGYFRVSDIKGKAPNSQIWQKAQKIKPYPVASIRGSVSDLRSKKPIKAKVAIIKPETAEQIFETETDDKGQYSFLLQVEKQYIMKVYQEGYSYKFSEINLVEIKKDTEIIQETSLFRNIFLFLNVFDQELFTPLSGTVSVKNILNGTPINVKADEFAPGKYKLQIPIGGNYEIAVDCPRFESDTFTFDVTDVVQFDEFEKDFELKPITEDFEISIADQMSEEGMDVEIEIKNLENNEVIIITDIDSGEQYDTKVVKNDKGKYVIKLREGGKYEINVRNPKGYAFYNTKVDLGSDQKDKKLDVKLTPLTAQTTLMLNNITFETNSAALNAASFTELNQVVKLMQDNPGISIEISAHTDDIGSDTYNLRLSDKRAQSVVKYLGEKSVEQARLIAKGYGESKPLVPNNSEENMAKNRRVELKVVDVDTNKE